jgi:1-acylglycerone phosphate reductase
LQQFKMTSKRTILITGCSDGSLGDAMVQAFHKAGWRVFASARNTAKLGHAKAAGVEIVQLDTLSDESIASSVAHVSRLTGGSLDALVNNAGGGYSMPLLDLDINKARELFDLNVWSVLSVTRAYMPLLLKSTRGGIVVNNTSCSALTSGALPFAGAYNASKAATLQLTENLRLELAPFGIKVINLMTGSVKSTFHADATETLPPDSMYNIAKEAVERTMSGADAQTDSTDPVKYAEAFASQLGKPNPPHWIFKGKFSTIARLAVLLPIGTTDGTVKKMSGIDVLERNIKQQKTGRKMD